MRSRRNLKFLYRIKRKVDKGWPDDINGIEAAQQSAEREAQGRQPTQRYIHYSLKGLEPRYLQGKAQEYLVETPTPLGTTFLPEYYKKKYHFKNLPTF